LNFALKLEKNYKVFRHKAYPNENYYVRSRQNRAQMLEDMLDWFDAFLKDRVGDVEGKALEPPTQ
jgi:dipeptidyl aminopeptidase/acylaminoacyl peptidase